MLPAHPQFLQYRHNIWLRWRKFNSTLQHPYNLSRFLLNLFNSMFACQHQMVPGDCIFTFYIFLCYWKHILYQKCAFPAVIQFSNMKNITWLS